MTLVCITHYKLFLEEELGLGLRNKSLLRTSILRTWVTVNIPQKIEGHWFLIREYIR